MISTNEIFSSNELFKVKSKAEEEFKDRIKKKEERVKEIQQIRGTVYAILDLVNTFKWHGEVINQIKFSKQSGNIKICVAVFRINMREHYINSIDRGTLAEFVKKAEEKVNELGYSSTCWEKVYEIINSFNGWYARCEFITGKDSLTIGFEE
ncbi:MAG: hypothetical protein HFJ50_09885 [Clostridia bacterium]|jgi:hypothetical protein|nr:hypothetical protein [Clostridia bacterium]